MNAVWPFLVARGRTRDYRTVLVPGFLADRGLQALLADRLPMPEPGGPAVATTVEHPGTGALSVLLRCAVLQPDDVGGRPARDEHGRRMEYVYGVVAVPGPAEADLDMARESALTSYRRFLADEGGFTFDRSAPLPGTAPTTAAVTAVSRPRTPPPAPTEPATAAPARSATGGGRGRRLAAAATGGLVLLVGVVALGSALTREPNPNLTVVCAAGGALQLRGSITLEQPGPVTFQLRVDGRDIGSVGTASAGGRQEVDLPVDAADAAAAQQAGEVEIRTEAGATTTSATYPYRCPAGR